MTYYETLHDLINLAAIVAIASILYYAYLFIRDH